MPRQARLFAPGYPMHVIQRGHNQQAIFHDDEDRRHFLEWLWSAARERQVKVHAWVLMTNHFHLCVTSPDAESLAKFVQYASQRYSQYYNVKYRRAGTLWQGRFKSSLIVSDHYLLKVYRYIDLNPVRARLVGRAEEFRWSSYRHHVGLTHEEQVSDHPLYWGMGNTPFDRQVNYRQFCDEAVNTDEAFLITSGVNKDQALVEAGQEHKILGANRSTEVRPRGRPSADRK